jgi:MFS family permease
VLAHTAFAGSRVTVSLFAISQGASTLGVGLLLTLYAVVPMLLSLASGRLIDRVGTRVPLGLSLVAMIVTLMVPALLSGWWALIVVALGMGSAFMMTHLALQHAVGQLSEMNGQTANYGWLALGFSTSSFLGPVLAGIVIDLLGYRAAFSMLALVAVLALLALMLARRGLPGPLTIVAREAKDSVWDLWTDSHLRRVFIAMAILSFAWDLYAFVVPVYGTSIGFSATTIGLIMGAFALATFLVRLVLPFFALALDPWRVMFTAMLIAIGVFLVFPWSTGVPQLMALTFCLGLGLGSTQPVVLALIHAGAPAGREGEALGVRSTIVNASSAVLPSVFGVVGMFFGLMPLFAVTAGVLALGALYVKRHWRSPR